MDDDVELLVRQEELLRDKEERLARLRAEVAGLRVQVALLREERAPDVSVREQLAAMTFSDAVVAVLVHAQVPLAPAQILERLSDAGRRDRGQSLGGILQSLKHQGRVMRADRGQWLALP